MDKPTPIPLEIIAAGLLAQILPPETHQAMLNILAGKLPVMAPDQAPESHAGVNALGVLLALVALGFATHSGISLLRGGHRRSDAEEPNRKRD